MDTVPSSLYVTLTPLLMASGRRRCTSPSVMLRWAMPLTPKQLVAAAPVMVVNTASLMVISPFSVGTFIIADFLSAEMA